MHASVVTDVAFASCHGIFTRPAISTWVRMCIRLCSFMLNLLCIQHVYLLILLYVAYLTCMCTHVCTVQIHVRMYVCIHKCRVCAFSAWCHNSRWSCPSLSPFPLHDPRCTISPTHRPPCPTPHGSWSYQRAASSPTCSSRRGTTVLVVTLI